MSCYRSLAAAALVATVSSAAFASGIIGPFTETFESDSAAWRNFNGSAELDWLPAGGPDGSGYASGTYNLQNASGFFPPVVLRAQQNFGSSGNAFVGDWIASGVIGFEFDIRHDLSEPITITGRFATPQNNPGAATESSIQVLPNTWTRVVFDLTPDSTDIISFGSGNYQSIFSNVGNIQLGFNVPQGLAGQDILMRLDIDNAGLVIPSPATIALVGFAPLVMRRRR